MAIETISIKDAADVTKNVLADLIGSDYGQVIKVAFGADGTLTLVESSVGLPVALLAGSNVIGKVDVNSAIPAGTNNIGDVDIASALPAGSNSIGTVILGAGAASVGTVVLGAGSALAGQVDLNSVPGAAATTDKITAVMASDAIGIGSDPIVQLIPKFFKANVSASSTDASLVTAVGGKKIRVLSFRIHAAGTATNVTFNSKPGGGGTAITELFACGANGGRSEGFDPLGHFETATGEGLTVTTGSGSTCGIGGKYVEV